MQNQSKEVPTLLGLHPAATLFPVMSDEEFKALVEDIREHGQLEPIIVLDGQVIDGRHRLQACAALGIEPNTEEFYGDDEDVYAFVVSKNLMRRHLSTSQRAMISSKVETFPNGGDRGEQHTANLPDASHVASVFKISERSRRSALSVRETGVPALVAAVERDEIPVSAAAVFAKTEPARQAQILAMPTAERREELQRIKAEQERVREIAREGRAKRGENEFVRFLEKNLRMPNAEEALAISKLDGLITPDAKGRNHSPIPPKTKEQKAAYKRYNELYADAMSLQYAMQYMGFIKNSPKEILVHVTGTRAFADRVGTNLAGAIAFLSEFAKEWNDAKSQ